jgi:hypothetical protein
LEATTAEGPAEMLSSPLMWHTDDDGKNVKDLQLNTEVSSQRRLH